MPQPDPSREEALKRLDGQLRAFDAKRKGPVTSGGNQKAAGEAYRMMAGLIGGLLGGLGLGWTFDHFVHTSPWGLVGGLLIGIGLSTYSAVRSAGRMSSEARAQSGPVAAVRDDEDDD